MYYTLSADGLTNATSASSLGDMLRLVDQTNVAAAASGTNLTFRTFTTALNFAEILECRGYHPYDFIH